jgi:hypothetical protein
MDSGFMQNALIEPDSYRKAAKATRIPGAVRHQ